MPPTQLNIIMARAIFTHKGATLYDESNITTKADRSVNSPFTRMAVDTLLMV